MLGLVVIEEAPLLAWRDEVEMMATMTVLLSMLLHGITAASLSAAYARRVERMTANAPEKRVVDS